MRKTIVLIVALAIAGCAKLENKNSRRDVASSKLIEVGSFEELDYRSNMAYFSREVFGLLLKKYHVPFEEEELELFNKGPYLRIWHGIKEIGDALTDRIEGWDGGQRQHAEFFNPRLKSLRHLCTVFISRSEDRDYFEVRIADCYSRAYLKDFLSEVDIGSFSKDCQKVFSEMKHRRVKKFTLRPNGSIDYRNAFLTMEHGFDPRGGDSGAQAPERDGACAKDIPEPAFVKLPRNFSYQAEK